MGHQKRTIVLFQPMNAEISPFLMGRSGLAIDRPGSARAMVFAVKFAVFSAR
jgi:hypothetical protein